MSLLDMFKKMDDDDFSISIRKSLDEVTNRTRAMQANNATHGLPFAGGDVYEGQDFRVRQVDVDAYQLIVEDRSNFLFGNMTLSGASNPVQMNHNTHMHMVDAATLRRIIDGDSFPEYGLHRMTDAERTELSELEKELKKWQVREKLNKFKTLPAHIRQSIVDESIVRDYGDNINVDEPITNFPDYDRLQELKNKRDPQIIFDRFRAGIRGNYSEEVNYKYGPILARFSTEELMEAHAEATLEDEIAD